MATDTTTDTSVTGWRSRSGISTDVLYAIDTLESVEDFSDRAAIYSSVTASEPFNLDLMFQSIDYNFAEHNQVVPQIGQSFSAYFFGKTNMQVATSVFLIDTGVNYDKTYLMDTYRNYLRLEAVARRGVAPVLILPNAALTFACNSMSIQQTANMEGFLTLSMSLIVIQAVFMSDSYTIQLDYRHGVETATTTTTSSSGDSDSGDVTAEKKSS